MTAGGKKIVAFVTGGIAAYKVVEVVRTLTQLGADVRVVMTPSAQRFVGPQTFAAISGNPVRTEVFDDGPEAAHVELARGADLALIAPATANSLAKLALGLAEDLVGSTYLMLRCPILVAPAMHTEMWEHETTRDHVRALRQRGIRFVGPDSGPLMSGDEGPGRMAEPDVIVGACLAVLNRAESLAGKTVLVAAGGTQEPLDAVRFIANRSSGLMGIEIAAAARDRGAKVSLVMGPTGRSAPPGVDVIDVRTAQEMREAVAGLTGSADAIVMAAAVADFRPASSSTYKLKKVDGPPDVVLVPTPDILAELGGTPSLRKEGSVLVGFAAETEDDPAKLADFARAKLEAKNADVIVANDVASGDSGFGVRTNRAVIVTRTSVHDVGLVSKEALAEALVDEISDLLEGGRSG